MRPVYQATAQILIERQLPSVLDFEKNPRASEAWEDFYQTQYRLLQSRLLARKAVERLDLLQDPEFGGPRDPAAHASGGEGARGDLRGHGEGDRPVPGPAPHPAREEQPARDHRLPVLAARARRASRQCPHRALHPADPRFPLPDLRRGRHWLDGETKEQAQKVQAAELALQKFSEEEGLANIEERRTLLEQKLKDLGSSLTAAKTRRLDKEALYQQMQATGNPEELPEVIASPLVQALRTELASLERQAAQLGAKGFLDEHPEMVKLRQQIEGTRQKIALEARRLVRAAQNDYRVAAAQEASASAALESAKTEAQDLSRRSLKYDALKRDLEASKKVSASILTRQKQTDVSRDVQASNVHVIDPASCPTRPSPRARCATSRSPWSSASACAIAGGLLPRLPGHLGGAAARREAPGRAPPRRHPRDEQGPSMLLLTNGHRKEAFAEGYRVLRTALQLRRPAKAAARCCCSPPPCPAKASR